MENPEVIPEPDPDPAAAATWREHFAATAGREPAPVGPGEIAEMVGLSRQRVDQLSRQRDFPEPWAELKTGRVWRDTDIEAWNKRRQGGK